jgi:hypothetical protein
MQVSYYTVRLGFVEHLNPLEGCYLDEEMIATFTMEWGPLYR